MNINRHNYEAFFLLYVDKELSITDTKAVEMFVQENPDLQIELTLLQNTIMSADDIVLDKKDWLYMEAGVSALQENLLLYADDELNPADKKTAEALLATNKNAKTEWAVLQQTKLQPDMGVVFADKQLLYRKGGGRVVGFTWWRVAAAAVLLGFGLWTGVSVYKNNFTAKPGSEELATKNGNTKQQQRSDTTANVTTVPELKTTTDNIASTKIQDNDQTTSPRNIKASAEKRSDQNSVAPKENITVQNNSNKKSDNNLPTPEREQVANSSLQNINNNKRNESVVANVQSSNSNSNRVSGNNDVAAKIAPRENTGNALTATNVNNGKPDQNNTAIQVVNDITADGGNNNPYLNVDDDKEKRTALGGFLRKAKRVIERTTNVKTGEGVKIAGFEIALK